MLANEGESLSCINSDLPSSGQRCPMSHNDRERDLESCAEGTDPVSGINALLDLGDRAQGQLCGMWDGASWDEEPLAHPAPGIPSPGISSVGSSALVSFEGSATGSKSGW